MVYENNRSTRSGSKYIQVLKSWCTRSFLFPDGARVIRINFQKDYYSTRNNNNNNIPSNVRGRALEDPIPSRNRRRSRVVWRRFMGHRCIETIWNPFPRGFFPKTKKKGATFDGIVKFHVPFRIWRIDSGIESTWWIFRNVCNLFPINYISFFFEFDQSLRFFFFSWMNNQNLKLWSFKFERLFVKWTTILNFGK